MAAQIESEVAIFDIGSARVVLADPADFQQVGILASEVPPAAARLEPAWDVTFNVYVEAAFKLK